jgi:hypothetical protein
MVELAEQRGLNPPPKTLANFSVESRVFTKPLTRR